MFIANAAEKLQGNLRIFQTELKKINMEIDIEKPKTTIISANEQKHKIELEDEILEELDSFN